MISFLSKKSEFDCNSSSEKGLRYDGFSIVFMQLFYIGKSNELDSCSKIMKDLELNPLVEIDEDAIDKQIFVTAKYANAPVKRYRIKGFDVKINFEEPEKATITGHVHVEMSVFFNKTISLTYRLVADGKKCRSSTLLTTDHLITLASLNESAEHWCCNDDGSPSTIDIDFTGIKIDNIPIDENSNIAEDIELSYIHNKAGAFRNVCQRYKKFVQNLTKTKYDDNSIIPDMNYVYIDIWESIKHYDDLFERLKEEDIISHIVKEHKRELVGLMTMYPAEWPYRSEEAYDDVCGSNVAIDTDDLILVNQNMCVVFGTYGLRGGKESPTDWQAHLKERIKYHVSWPEYLLILEMVLAKKYTIAFANEVLLNNMLNKRTSRDSQSAIEANASLNLNITKLLLLLDAVKYSKFVSHKIMYDRTCKRLSIDSDLEKLIAMMDKIDNSLNNIRDVRSLKQGTMMNVVLASISVASLFQIIFMELRIPFLDNFKIESTSWGIGIIFITAFLIIFGLLSVVVFLISNKWKR